MVHAIVVHMPIALSVLGVPAALVAAFFGREKTHLRWLVVVLYLTLLLASVVAVQTGEDAEHAIPSGQPQAMWDVENEHEEMAEKVWIFALATALLALLSVPKVDGLRLVMSVLMVIGSLACAGWVGLVGHHGGTLVYVYGVGTPAVEKQEPAPLPVPDTGSPDAEPTDPGPTDAEETPAEAINGGAEPETPIENTDLIAIRDIDMDEAAKVSFANDIFPILDKKCNAKCHSDGEYADAELDMTTYDLFMKGGEDFGTPVVPGKPDESVIVDYIRGIETPRMPKKEDALSEDEVHLFRQWIAAGALNN